MRLKYFLNSTASQREILTTAPHYKRLDYDCDTKDVCLYSINTSNVYSTSHKSI